MLPDWDLFAVDLLGHGRRAHFVEPKPLTLDVIAQDLMDQILERKRDGDALFALGHSFGLRPLLKIASQRPELISGIVAEDSCPELSEQGYNSVKSYLVDVPVPFESRESARTWFDAHLGSQSTMSRFLLSQIREQGSGVHTWRFDKNQILALLEESRNNPLWLEWESFDGPIQMILGDRGSFVSDQRLKKSRDLRTHRPLAVDQIGQSGHWVHSDQLELFCVALKKCLEAWVA
jgi:pimeloyl-ACP methyl ester carboxylesterase